MKINDMYGAVIERGIVERVMDGMYTVRSLSRDGVWAEDIQSCTGIAHDIGEQVYFFLFDDGDGMVL